MARLVVQEPGGERQLALPVRIGGMDPDIALPAPGARLAIDVRGAQWMLRIADGTVLLNGRAEEADCQLAQGDVIETGGAHLVLHLDSGDARLTVYPLRGNDTIAPLATVQLPGEEVIAGTREIRVTGAAEDADAVAAHDAGSSAQRRRFGGVMAAAMLLGAMLVAALWWIVPVPLDVIPATATLEPSGRLHWRLGNRLYLPQGAHTLEVSQAGYRSERVMLEVNRALAEAPPRRIELALLPGALEIDTHGIAAEVLIDGEPAGAAPGTLSVGAGRRSVLVRAPRHIDFLTEVDVEGAGRKQSLAAKLEPAWGWLELDSRPGNARIQVDGKDLGTTPQRVELDSGLHQLSIRAAGRSWRSQVAIVAGQTLALGVIDLAAPPPAMLAQAAPPASAATSAAQVPAPAPAAPASRVQSPLVGTLILVPAGSFQQGSERREQGRRSNESLRTVTFAQPFYLAEREVINSAFRTFRAGHLSGIAADRTLDLDGFAVSSVDWEDAVAFCNWLSQRESLPLAYERREGRWQLVEPFNHGYRLPTEAEWEYAARYVDGQRFRRFSWGDALPPPAGAENISGDEAVTGKTAAARAVPTLPGHVDEHVVVAPAGSYARTALGFADMGGNVSEWMHDVYASLLPSTPVTNPRGDSTTGAHVIRGANWRTYTIQELRLAWRDRAEGKQQTVGFRIARNVEAMP